MSETNANWHGLYKAGGLAALLASVLFRRNIGAEVSLFTGVEAIPHSAADWFVLLQSNPFVGLSFLAIFDLVNYALVGLMFLALSAALWQTRRSVMVVAVAGGLVGIAANFASNISLSMLSLSQQYAVAAPESKPLLLAAGQSLLATNNPLAILPETGVYVSLLLIALAGLLFSVVMLQNRRFGRVTAMAGLVASGCDLSYCLTFAFAPFLDMYLMASGGLFWMIWHLLVARRLLQLSKE